MTEETKDGSQVSEGVVETPPVPQTPAGSEGESSGEIGLDAAAYEKIAVRVVEQLKPELDNLVDARYKSGTDSRLAREGKLTDAAVERVKAYLDEAGGDVTKASRAMAIDDMLAQGSEGAGGTATQVIPQTQEKSIEDRTAELLSEYREVGVTITNDELETLIASKKPSEWNDDLYIKEISKLAIKKGKQQNVSEGSLVGGSSSPAGDTSTNLVDLYARLEETQRAPSEHEEERAAILRQIQELESA